MIQYFFYTFIGVLIGVGAGHIYAEIFLMPRLKREKNEAKRYFEQAAKAHQGSLRLLEIIRSEAEGYRADQKKAERKIEEEDERIDQALKAYKSRKSLPHKRTAEFERGRITAMNDAKVHPVIALRRARDTSIWEEDDYDRGYAAGLDEAETLRRKSGPKTAREDVSQNSNVPAHGFVWDSYGGVHQNQVNESGSSFGSDSSSDSSSGGCD